MRAPSRMSRRGSLLEQSNEPAIQSLPHGMMLSVEPVIPQPWRQIGPATPKKVPRSDADGYHKLRGHHHSSRLMHIARNSQRFRDNDVHQMRMQSASLEFVRRHAEKVRNRC